MIPAAVAFAADATDLNLVAAYVYQKPLAAATDSRFPAAIFASA